MLTKGQPDLAMKRLEVFLNIDFFKILMLKIDFYIIQILASGYEKPLHFWNTLTWLSTGKVYKQIFLLELTTVTHKDH